MKQVNGHQVVQLLEQFSPKAFAMEGDPVGLQTGALNRKVSKVLTTLDVTHEVVDEAIEKGANFIIAHHPLIFRPLKTINLETSAGRLIEKCIKNDITVFAAHTNLDVAKGGVNDMLSEALGLQEPSVLVKTFEDTYKKLIVFVPETHASIVRDAITAAGAGQIGDYSDCTFTTAGTGRFKPDTNAKPFIGEQGSIEEVKEEKVESIFKASNEKEILHALKSSHPYEEPAFDVFEQSIPGEVYGLGRVGKLKEPVSLGEFTAFVKKQLNVPAVRVTGDPEKQIKKAAVLGGMGSKYFQTAKFAGADVYITGDVDFHTAQDAEAAGLSIIDPGHHVEEIMKTGLAVELTKRANNEGLNVEFIPSSLSTEPFTFM
ncbi:Nif3-like dinuclear metal center hexameric protein [Jeotgalibacillus haloalkalitolerans]|uniref:GTP cyclohydrolase 1 type 2 homolog n=1 Tax=Jeotgalibacillus haloalkalitolerans TaxID=3104292 RepID=A0ABU5KLR2_9BACL|nr:Nif3-like dinuclear metal center hexameric protein [Jeotgalibacillus sp. HH7-29]MDZ5712191.1 Nif3-like dinuclear metal center hexameric protein [Jeotgalibacillus sp. HH7-29]